MYIEQPLLPFIVVHVAKLGNKAQRKTRFTHLFGMLKLEGYDALGRWG